MVLTIRSKIWLSLLVLLAIEILFTMWLGRGVSKSGFKGTEPLIVIFFVFPKYLLLALIAGTTPDVKKWHNFLLVIAGFTAIDLLAIFFINPLTQDTAGGTEAAALQSLGTTAVWIIYGIVAFVLLPLLFLLLQAVKGKIAK